MSKDDRHLEENIDRLVSRTRPGTPMPDGARERVLEALLAEASSSRSAKPGSGADVVPIRRRITWLTAAAAAIILAVVLFWPAGIENGVTWADVTRHLDSVKSVIADITIDEPMPDGARTTTFWRLYQRDPGLSRIEEYTTARRDEIKAITITVSTPEEGRAVLLKPEEKWALVFNRPSAENEGRAGRPYNPVAEEWARLRGVAADQTRRIGERDVNGTAAVGFEADLEDLIPGPHEVRPAGSARVWVAVDTGAPVEVELETVDPDGELYVSRMENFQWNAHVPSALFETPDLDGWEIEEFEPPPEVHETEFSGKRSLRSGVTLRVWTPDGVAILTEDDIEVVDSGRTVRYADEDAPHMFLSITTTPEAGKRLREYTSNHLEEQVVIDFNGEVRYEITIGGVLDRHIQIEINPLGKTLAEIESDYLTDAPRSAGK